MQSLRLPSSFPVSLLLVAVLAGCAAGRDPHSGHGAAGMDANSTCEMHRKHMAGKTAAEQQALMQEHMKEMKPEMRERMRDMHAQCK